MKKIFGNLLTLLLIFPFLGSHMLNAQSADEILAKYYKVCGSPEIWKTYKTMKMEGTASTQGISLNGTVLTMRPNKQKVEFDFQGMKIIEAYDGKNAWSINPFMGATTAQLSDSLKANEMAKQTFEDELIGYKDKGHKVSYEGEDEVEGAKVYKIKLTKKSGEDVFYFIDKENNVPILIKSFVNTGADKGGIIENYLSDYQEIDKGVMMAHATKIVSNGATVLEMTITKVEMNPSDVSDATFQMPTDK
ncbi:MAG: hypothetical protein KA010_00095 [Saprospiraceae bacterium]|nr:hypothetical protein [Saprospiraceae bacterium]